jgi:hypothetical protein
VRILVRSLHHLHRSSRSHVFRITRRRWRATQFGPVYWTDIRIPDARYLTVYEALAVERLSHEQRPMIRHWVNPTVDRDLVGLQMARDWTDKRSEQLCTSRSQLSAPYSQFRVIYDIATTLKLRRRHLV